jgi:hypothetical protein
LEALKEIAIRQDSTASDIVLTASIEVGAAIDADLMRRPRLTIRARL